MADCIINSMDMGLSKLKEIVEDRRAWWAIAHGVAKRRTRLGDCTATNVAVTLLSPPPPGPLAASLPSASASLFLFHK